MKKLLLSFLFVCLLCSCSNENSVPATPLIITNDDIQAEFPGLYPTDGIPIYSQDSRLEDILGFQEFYGKGFKDPESGEDVRFMVMFFLFDTEQNANMFRQTSYNSDPIELSNSELIFYNLPEDIKYYYDPEGHMNSVFHYGNAVIQMVFYNENPSYDVVFQVLAHTINALQYQKLKLASE